MRKEALGIQLNLHSAKLQQQLPQGDLYCKLKTLQQRKQRKPQQSYDPL